MQKQYPSEGAGGSLFPGIEDYPQKFLFSAIESEELRRDFDRDGGSYGEDLSEEGELLAMIATTEVSEMRKFVAELIAL